MASAASDFCLTDDCREGTVVGLTFPPYTLWVRYQN